MNMNKFKNYRAVATVAIFVSVMIAMLLILPSMYQAFGEERNSVKSSYPYLDGDWESDYKKIKGKGTKWEATSISQSGSSLTFTNEFGSSSKGKFVSDTEVEATEWEVKNGKGLRADILSNGKISWANGTTWRRKE